MRIYFLPIFFISVFLKQLHIISTNSPNILENSCLFSGARSKISFMGTLLDFLKAASFAKSSTSEADNFCTTENDLKPKMLKASWGVSTSLQTPSMHQTFCFSLTARFLNRSFEKLVENEFCKFLQNWKIWGGTKYGCIGFAKPLQSVFQDVSKRISASAMQSPFSATFRSFTPL